MSNDNKTLADVQPGGRVRLGDKAERARFEAFLSGNPLIALSAGMAWQVWQAALSAQPSPGGQDGPVYEGHTWVSDYVLAGLRERAAMPLQLRNGEVWHWQGDGHDFPESLVCPVIMSAETLRTLLAARQPVVVDLPESLHDRVEALREVAARQPVEFERAIPTRRRESAVELLLQLGFVWNNQRWEDRRQSVGATEQPYNSGGIELTACQLHEALLMAGSPELDVPFEDRSLVRIFWTETGHSGPGLYCECVGAEEEGCILLDGTAPAIGQPAQAVDLAENMLSVLIEEGVLARNGRVFQKLRALIDSMAVGK
ncbi:hypothetical protein JAK47_06335 [Stenotrophomonas maltophilia]|uniref:hypothetical protein n=1 Tax=Stenotrophomonas maltophilia TaxID=40324 RepID=UPI0021C65D57|nr:hypothetical protein [Stenotrophomonas maltophilia]MCU1054152.1 hypothetical protein [Stenotrophomonas maltophilia]